MLNRVNGDNNNIINSRRVFGDAYLDHYRAVWSSRLETKIPSLLVIRKNRLAGGETELRKSLGEVRDAILILSSSASDAW